MAREATKRVFDLTLVALALPLVLPLAAVVALVVRFRLGAPVLFMQGRPGRDCRIFRMIKFRSMAADRDDAGQLLPDEQRLGAFGRFLRNSSLDELPELWNVITGDMSLVGPRPLMVEYLPLYSPEQARRHEVRPGITGWAQVNGRNLLSWEEKFALDVWYVDNWSLWLDLKILARTVARVMSREGISAPGDATMPRFTGSSLTDKSGSDAVLAHRRNH